MVFRARFPWRIVDRVHAPPGPPEPTAARPSWRRAPDEPSLPEIFRSVPIGRGAAWRRLLAFLGPGYLVAVGYMDPGNWATDLAGGSRYGYSLLGVVLLSSLAAIVLQGLAIKLGIVTGRDLAQACRDHYPLPVAMSLWVLCEIAIIACDLAEVLGTAIGLQLLVGLPLLWGVCLTSVDALLVLWLQQRGFRWIEAFVVSLIVLVGICFGIELALAGPEWGGVARGLLPDPRIAADPGKLFIALGILGATIMPHNLFLHSSIVQTRSFERTLAGRREALRFAFIDSTVALAAAFFINAAILVVAAAAFHHSGHTEVAQLQDAHRLLSPLLGTALASALFAVALIASGQNSTITGTLAGQVVMEGFLRLRLPPAARRLVTRLLAIVPAAVAIAVGGDAAAGTLLLLSQVVLSLQLSFAIFPLLRFTNDRGKMGEFVNRAPTRLLGWGICLGIAALNLWLLVQACGGR
jgi:manganese transport protein